MASRRNSKKTSAAGILLVLIAITIYILFPDLLNNSASTPATTIPSSGSGNTSSDSLTPTGNTNGKSSLGWLTVYFTNPNPPDDIANSIDQYIIPLVDQAKTTIDVASFDLNLPSVVNALAAASKRGVKIRVVYDGMNGNLKLESNRTEDGKEFGAIAVLKKAGASLVDGGRSNGLMHDKMIIIDSQILLVGSWNMAYNDTYRNNNNLLKITNAQLIANYQAKFNEFFEDKLFGTHAQLGAQNPRLTIAGVKVENYFSPPDQVMEKLIAYVNGAKRSVRFIIFTYTDIDLANAMIERYKAGVDVAGVIENRGASQGAFVPLYCAKVPTKLDGNKYTMHHKVIIIDETTVITGSFNFTKSADHENDDNVIIIHDPAVAKLYLEEYARVAGIAQDPKEGSTTCK